jgi:hypothetical protein
VLQSPIFKWNFLAKSKHTLYKGDDDMSLLLILIFVSYFIVCFVSYTFLFKIKNLIGYHLGMNLAMSSSGVMGIAVGTILGYAFPAHYTAITIVTTVIAMLIGAIFGALVDYQTLLSGISSGVMAGIMGPMIGVVADLGLITFCTILVYLTFGMLCFSIRS